MLQLLAVLLSGVVYLLGLIAFRHLRRRITDPYRSLRARTPFPRSLVKRLRRAARADVAKDVMLLMERVTSIRRAVRRLPALPADARGTPRMLSLARELAAGGHWTTDDMGAALCALSPAPTPSEATALALCVAVAQCERLDGALRVLHKFPAYRQEVAEDVRAIVCCLRYLQALNWTRHASSADPIHTLLMDDPSGIYAKMDLASQAETRRRAEKLGRSTRQGGEEAVQAALRLCQQAEPDALEASLPYWFWDARGMRTLRKALGRRGWWYVWHTTHPEAVRYGLLLVWAFLTGFAFLQWRQPILLLPAFLLLTGRISRLLLSRWGGVRQPALSEVPAELRTLVVLPAVLHDEHEAIRLVRRMKVLRCAFPTTADLLLVGDFEAHMSPLSASAQAIMTAAASAIEALGGLSGRVMYLQRAQARGGSQGAIGAVCRLVARSECEDVLLCATVEAAMLHKRYAFVLTLPEEAAVVPGMLTRLLRKLYHTLYNN